MRATIKIVVATLLAGALAQCGSHGDKDDATTPEGCIPTSVRRCTGSWSCKGGQVCGEEGTWSACLCDPTVPGYDGGADYDASASYDAGGLPDVHAVDLPAASQALRYVLLDDMEGSALPNGPIPFSAGGAGAGPGFWGSWLSTGDPSNRMSPDPFAYASLPVPHETLAGVTSTRAAHLGCRVADLYGYCEQGVWLAQRSASSGVDAGLAAADAAAANVENRVPVDLSDYQGIVFWAMADKPARLKIVAKDAETDVLGGRCGRTDASADQCGDAFTRQVPLTDSWRRYEVKWSELSQDGWGHAAPSGKLDPRTIYLIGFQIDGPQSNTALPVEVDFWIDDVYFFQPLQGTGAQDGGAADGASASDAPSNGCITGSDELIADFLDDSGLRPVDGRKGAFDVQGDSLGSFVPPKSASSPYPVDLESGNGQCSGAGSFHTKAAGFADWGAAISADLAAKSMGGAKGTYDASRYRGVSFWARASAPVAGVKVSFPDIYTDGGANPGTLDPTLSPCVFQSGSKFNCSPYLVKFGDSDFPAYKAYQIDTTWKRFDILFADTQQDFFNPGFHTADNKLDTKHLTSIAIQIGTLYEHGIAKPNDFELWIDDVYFIK